METRAERVHFRWVGRGCPTRQTCSRSQNLHGVRARTTESPRSRRAAAVVATAPPLLCPASHTLLPAFSCLQIVLRRESLHPRTSSPGTFQTWTKNQRSHLAVFEKLKGKPFDYRLIKYTRFTISPPVRSFHSALYSTAIIR